MDYTPEGIKEIQGDIAVSQLYLIDKKLAKISRRLSVIALIAVGLAAGVVFDKYSKYVKEFKYVEGE